MNLFSFSRTTFAVLTIAKFPLRLNFSEALTRAERDIKENWWIYRERFLKGEFP
jgi:hypothetical protein